ncbi:MAG: type II toxin-antitoxin system Phd/YefM family antitoxin [Nitrospinota bacterium]
MKTITAAKARADLSDVLYRAGYGKERIAITRRGKTIIAVVVPPEDAALLEDLEDRADISALRKAEADYRTGRDRGRPAEEVFAEIDAAEKQPSLSHARGKKPVRPKAPRRK